MRHYEDRPAFVSPEMPPPFSEDGFNVAAGVNICLTSASANGNSHGRVSLHFGFFPGNSQAA
jgi:hypothetical protein